MISGLGEGEQVIKSVLKQGGGSEGLGVGQFGPGPGVHDGDLGAGDDALAASGDGGVARKRSAVRGGIASAAAARSQRRPGPLVSMVDM
jgi:hypothetical protein